MDLAALTHAVVQQRQERMNDIGPGLRGVGSARFQHNGSTLFVSGAHAKSGKAAELVDRIARYAREHMMTISWTHISSYDDERVREAIEGAGFHTTETLHLMGHIGLLNSLPPPLGVTVAPVVSVEEMQQYERISAWGFNHNEHPSPEHLAVRGRERWDEQQANWYAYFIGRYHGEIAGGAYVSLWERVPTIYGVVTAPPMQGHGVAAQVMIALVQQVMQRNFPWTCLYVAEGNPAERLYTRLGYVFLARVVTYALGLTRW